METPHLLKNEINDTLASLHDFAKWKLIVTSALAAAAFGLTSPGKATRYWLLLFIPYACAYVDLNCYQYLIRITVIARCLREAGQEDELLNKYERLCEQLREKHGVFSLGEYAAVAVSLTISFLALVFAVIGFKLSKDRAAMWLALTFGTLGFFLGLALWLYYKHKNKAANKGSVSNQDVAELSQL